MANVSDRYPNLWIAGKVVFLLALVLAALILMSMLLLAGSILYLAVTGEKPGNAPEAAISALMDNVWVSGSFLIIQNIVLLLIAILYTRFVDGRKDVLHALGLRPEGNSIQYFTAGALIDLAFTVTLISILAITSISSLKSTGLSTYGMVPLISSLAAIAIGTLLVGFGEEAIFRGCLQRMLTDRYGAVTGIIATSIVFALFHTLTPFSRLGPLYILGVFGLSLLLGYLFLITRSLYASIGFHFFQDFLSLQVFSISGESTMGALPFFTFTKPGEIFIHGFFLGSWDDLIGVGLCFGMLGLLYLYRKIMVRPK
ncbi:MAG TPA: CPBP family intramembrane glutamic endopeptidase [Methanocella sp.]|nr:CPBP family intramembrane glutamic endopeptidase [Methanocella sp.]